MPERPPGVEGRAARGCDSEQTGEGKAWHRDMAELWGGLLGSRHAPHVSQRGRKDGGHREAKTDSRPGAEGWRRLKGTRSERKCLAPPLPTWEAQIKEDLR